MTFSAKLEYGKAGESRIASYFKSKGYSVLPVYEKEMTEHKGPTIFAFDGTQVIAPDMLVFGSSGCFWIEAKRKAAFTYHRNTSRWVTGIDLHHYENYLRVSSELSPWPVWLLFLHERGNKAKDTPEGMESPYGLFGNDLVVLRECENHRHSNWGKHGMVYWARESLKLLHLDAAEIAA